MLKSSILVGFAMVAPCFAAPSNLTGKTLVLNYTQAIFCYSDDGATLSGWQSYEAARQNVNGCARVFNMLGLKPKATRNLLPITAPGQGGKYTYRKTGVDTGIIEVDMSPMDAGRTIILKFTSTNTAIATETVIAGTMFNFVRNISVTIK
ncbi:MAG: hypothetical protein IJB31_01735 [Akkermansia sp.]|nr:hypothetical protein [Akkermansia sp.]